MDQAMARLFINAVQCRTLQNSRMLDFCRDSRQPRRGRGKRAAEIACYGTLASTAQQAGHEEVAVTLRESLSEEQRMEERLSGVGIALANRGAAPEPQPA